MAFARDTYVASSSQTDFTISFASLDDVDISVFKNDVLMTNQADADSISYVIVTSSIVRFGAGLTSGDNVVIIRTTSQGNRLVDYQTASTLTEEDLDNDSLQAFYMAQEAIDQVDLSFPLGTDGNWDAEGNLIKNVGTPVDPMDAATKAYADALAIAQGNVPTPTNPGDDGFVLTANAGVFDWATAGGTANPLGAGGNEFEYDNTSNFVAMRAAGTTGGEIRVDDDGRVLIGDVTADIFPHDGGGVLVSVADSAVLIANVFANAIIIEDDTTNGISILVPNTEQGTIVFGDPEDNNAGRLIYDHNVPSLAVFTEGSLALTIDGSQDVVFTGSVTASSFVGGGDLDQNLRDAMTMQVSSADDVQSFTSSGTWTKDGSAVATSLVLVIATGSGGGGGSGAEDPNPGVDGGGGGGAGGNTVVGLMRAGNLGATEAITLSGGGSGGSPPATNTVGNPGSQGGRARFGAIINAPGGVGGTGGSGSVSPGGRNSFDQTQHWGVDPTVAQELLFAYGGDGGDGNDDVSEVTAGDKGNFAGGGGGGTGVGTPGNGKDGGSNFGDGVATLTGGGGTGGSSSNGSNGTASGFLGEGGGGASNGNFKGGNGSVNGGGGGGGGSVNGTNSNTDGGDGGAGCVFVYTWF